MEWILFNLILFCFVVFPSSSSLHFWLYNRIRNDLNHIMMNTERGLAQKKMKIEKKRIVVLAAVASVILKSIRTSNARKRVGHKN